MQIAPNATSPVVDLLCQDTNSNTRGIVQLTGGTSSYNSTLVAYVDYDAYGSPISEAGGAWVPGGLTVTTGGYQYSVTPFGFGGSTTDASSLDYLARIHQ